MHDHLANVGRRCVESFERKILLDRAPRPPAIRRSNRASYSASFPHDLRKRHDFWHEFEAGEVLLRVRAKPISLGVVDVAVVKVEAPIGIALSNELRIGDRQLTADSHMARCAQESVGDSTCADQHGIRELDWRLQHQGIGA